MTYRDEREALRGRIQGLEQDLQDARRVQQDDEAKRARIAQIEARMHEAEGDLKAMRAELETLGAARRPKRLSWTVVAAAVAVVLVGASVASFRLLQPAHQAPFEEPLEPAVAAPPPPEVETPAPTAIPTPAETARAAVPPVEVQWTGKVTRANGLAIGPGAPCVVSATLASDQGKARVSRLSVKCGDKVLYQSWDKLEGMSMSSYGFAEEPGKEAGTFAYAVKYGDTGARSGPRTQVSLDTTQGQGAVWSDVVPMFRVEFSVPALSPSVKTERLTDATSETEPK